MPPPTPERYRETEEGLKRCRLCETVKPVADFYPRKDHRRFSGECRDCQRALMREHYRETSEAVIARVTKWIAEHPDQRRETQTAYRDRNRPKVQQRARDGAKRRRQEDPTKHHGYDRSQTLRRRGLTQDAFDALLAAQGGACAICRSPEPKGRGTWHIDHCHETGRIRGLLCHGCNSGIGLLGENPDRMARAAEYLRSC